MLITLILQLAAAAPSQYHITFIAQRPLRPMVVAEISVSGGRLTMARGGGIDHLPNQWAMFVREADKVTFRNGVVTVAGTWVRLAAATPRNDTTRVSLFAEGRVTTVNGLAFEPDGRTLYVSRWVEGLDYRGRRRARLFAHRLTNGAWSPPEALAFSREYTDYQPVLSPDASRLFFTSTRPIPGSDSETRQNIWYVDRAAGDWAAPQLVAELAMPGWDGYAVPTKSGRLYFVSDRRGGHGAVDIWVAERLSTGRYSTPENLTLLNSEHSDSDIYVDPDERFIIFHRSVDATREIDFWIAFRDGSEWLPPRRLDEVNGPGWELSPTLTPDAQRFLFNRDGSVYQIDFCALVRPNELKFVATGQTPLCTNLPRARARDVPGDHGERRFYRIR